MSDDSDSATLDVEAVDALSRPRRPGATGPPVAGMAVFISALALLLAAYAVHRTQREAR